MIFQKEYAGSKYAARYREGTNIVRLDDDIAAIFPNWASSISNNPPAPLKVAFRGAHATPTIDYRLKAVNQFHKFSCSSR